MPVRSADEIAAPKKPRPARSWAAGCFSTLLLFGLVVAAYIAWANMLPPPRAFPTVKLPSPNGYDAVLAVLPRLSAAPGNAEVSEFNRRPLSELRAAVRQQKPYLNELRAALKLPYHCPRITDPDDPQYRSFASARQAARSLGAEARVAFADGLPADGWSSSLDALELGVKLHRGGFLIHHLVGVAVCSIGESRADGKTEGLSAVEARAARERLDRIISQLPPLREIVTEEHRLAELWFRKQATGPPRMTDWEGTDLGWGGKAKQVGLRYFYPKSWSARALNDFWDAAGREAAKPSWQRVSLPAPSDPFLVEEYMDPVTMMRHYTRLQAALELLRLQLVLHEHRTRFGGYPTALSELSKLGVTLQPDPFTGKPLAYRRTASGYLLYSAGPNAVDDGGVPPSSTNRETGDLVAGSLVPGRR